VKVVIKDIRHNKGIGSHPSGLVVI
jgi:hypothetical protein